MDAVIRFCFSVDPEDILKPKTLNECYSSGQFIKHDPEAEYAKLYGQAKWILDYTNIMQAKKAADLVNG